MARAGELKKPSASSAKGMPFIVSSNVDKADSATRKLIRSHARQGRTKKVNRRADEKRAAGWGTIAVRTQRSRVELRDVVETYTPLVPGRIGSDIYFIEFPEQAEQSMVLNMARFSIIASGIIFPLRAAIGFQEDSQKWSYLFGLDPTTLHITAFAVQGFVDRVLRRQESSTNPAAIMHFQKGLRLLRERLLGNDDIIKVSNSTISAVMKLASVAHFDGNCEASKHHMEGLSKMINLRGGLDVFKGTLLLMEAVRCDIGIALLTGSAPTFYRQPSELLPEYPKKLIPVVDNKLRGTESIPIEDNELLMAWQVMRKFCLLVDLGAQTERLIRPEIIDGTMAAVMYRLLHMDFASDSIDEAIRHGLLTFSYHIFLQWQDIRPPYHRFATTFKNCIINLHKTDGISPRLMLWLLIIGSVSIFDIADDTWLRELMQEYADQCQVKTWKEMQEVLKSFMWIVLLDEPAGRKIYDLLGLKKGKPTESTQCPISFL
ncbi:uncharacterized protein F4822DRAFT_294691 [Hypoxylon trugodes]|uniref:uncharacterized protein n=1 Tax=Hypoxylon trugodes TaxID=326681 RepID=UPI002196BCC1|nr:uncharacterized protein F4822DRAFT_294691 [Hypoxylon trugodes]KAI1387869.1 hypothetical protein F4822DRAFT_294691 [Hypoxylon trugodes]